jgi:hypothetical protein
VAGKRQARMAGLEKTEVRKSTDLPSLALITDGVILSAVAIRPLFLSVHG